jgi:catechol 2,3-dioxygenase-like lactoylglutathione lyase family enzyme
MANERTYPALPCRDLEESLSFYKSLGFKPTYKQLRPYPYAVVALEDIHIHLFGMENFNPADSYGTTIIVVPDPDSLYKSFADGLRQSFGKLPAAGIPRILRPRKKFGTVRGFSVVDPGGNWLRIYKLNDTEEEDSLEKEEGLPQILLVAARLGDSRGDEKQALRTLESGLKRFKKDATTIDLARAYLYRAELAVRIGDHKLAESSFQEAKSVKLGEDEKSSLVDEFANITELIDQK